MSLLNIELPQKKLWHLLYQVFLFFSLMYSPGYAHASFASVEEFVSAQKVIRIVTDDGPGALVISRPVIALTSANQAPL